MKKFIVIAVIFAGSLFAPQTADAQIDIRVNIGMQPIWGPRILLYTGAGYLLLCAWKAVYIHGQWQVGCKEKVASLLQEF